MKPISPFSLNIIEVRAFERETFTIVLTTFPPLNSISSLLASRESFQASLSCSHANSSELSSMKAGGF